MEKSMSNHYTSVNEYLIEQFGEKVYKLSLNAGLTCPNRDGTIGTGGCIFCSEGGSGDFAMANGSIYQQIEDAKTLISSKTNCRKFIAYFQAFTNTYGPIEYLRNIFTEAINHPDIVVLSIATRCDCISNEVLELLMELNQIKPVWIEMGLQSIHPQTLELIKCGYTFDQFKKTTSQLSDVGIDVIAHIILGLPGETQSMMLNSIKEVCNLPIKGIKLSLLHVLKNTELADMYASSPWPMMSLEEYCHLVVACIDIIPDDIVVHRITGDGPRKLLIAPTWSTDKKRILNTINQLLRN